MLNLTCIKIRPSGWCHGPGQWWQSAFCLSHKTCSAYRWHTQVDLMSARAGRCVMDFKWLKLRVVVMPHWADCSLFVGRQELMASLWVSYIQSVKIRLMDGNFSRVTSLIPSTSHTSFALYSFMPQEILSHFVRQMSLFFSSFTVSFHPRAPHHHNGSSISAGRLLPRDSLWEEAEERGSPRN